MKGGSGRSIGGAGTLCVVILGLAAGLIPDPAAAQPKAKLLHGFATLPNIEHGVVPMAGLVMDSAGVLYGTTSSGGSCAGNTSGCGVVLALGPPAPGHTVWAEAVLHRFAGAPDGDMPQARLALGPDGTLYGTTYRGGVACPVVGAVGCGTVFAVTPPAPGHTVWRETVLHSFRGSDGAAPLAGLMLDASGNL